MAGDPLESPGDLADEFADFETDERPFCPLSCELFAMSPDKAAELQAKHPPVDPYVDRLAIARMVGAQKDWIRHPGTNAVAYFPPTNTTRAWLAGTFGPGSYLVQARNAGNQILGNQRCDAGVAPGTAPPGFFHPQSPGAAPGGQPFSPPAPQYPPPYGYPPSPYQGHWAPPPAPPTETLAEKFMMRMMDRFSQQLMSPPPQAPHPPMDPIRDSVAEIAKLAAQRPPQTESLADKLLPGLIADLLAERRKPNPSSEGSPEKTIALLKLGASLFGKKGKQDDAESWIEIIPDIVDSIGPALIVSLAQAGLPQEKADAVGKAVEAHMNARKAEAEAGGSTIDTEGETVAE